MTAATQSDALWQLECEIDDVRFYRDDLEEAVNSLRSAMLKCKDVSKISNRGLLEKTVQELDSHFLDVFDYARQLEFKYKEMERTP